VTGDDIRRAGITTLPEALRLPAIALSAFAGRDAEMRARNAGVQRFVSKPYDFVELVLAVADVSRIGTP